MTMARQSARFYATGQRKTSIARVFISWAPARSRSTAAPPRSTSRARSCACTCSTPLRAVDHMGNFDLFVTVAGGGDTGQAEAMRHGIARALRSTTRPCARP